MCLGNGVYIQSTSTAASGYSWVITSGNSSNAYLNDYGNGNATFNSYVSDCYGLQLNLTNSCGTVNAGGFTICVNNCFYRLSVYPNPASDIVMVQFDETKNADALPDEIKLVSEKSTLPVRSINV
ncbi:hypothetical protein GCM10028807_25350 [Spirosoma daeguense]